MRALVRTRVLALLGAALLAVACAPDAPPAQVSGAPSNGAFKSVISSGERVTLAEHASASGRTVFEFTADW